MESSNSPASAIANLAALVNVPYGDTNGSMRPLGIACIVAYVRAAGLIVDAYDFSDSRQPIDDITARFGLGRYRVIGLSFYNVNALLAYQMARAIKRINPTALIVAGGPHASAADMRMLERHPEIDLVVRNEGEETFLEILRAVSEGRAPTGLLGTTYRRDLDAKRGTAERVSAATRVSHRVIQIKAEIDPPSTIIREPDRGRIQDMDSLPPPLVDFIGDNPEATMLFPEPGGRSRRAVAIVTSRSCPYNCNFCAIIVIGREWRAASPEKVASDFLALDASAGGTYEHVYFLDANFFVNSRRAVDIAYALQRAKPGITFSFATRVNQVIKGEQHLPKLVSLGLRMIELGIESGSSAALARFAKDVTAEDNDRALEILDRHNIQLGLDFIMFDAEATLQDLELNLDLFERHNLNLHVPWESYFNYMTPYLGTRIRDHYESLVGRKFDDDQLPDPSTLIMDPTVRHIFDEFHKLCVTVGNMQTVVERLDSNLHNSARERARRRLNGTSVRRFYYATLRNLIGAARLGRLISVDEAAPKVLDDRGQLHSWEQVVSHALQ